MNRRMAPRSTPPMTTVLYPGSFDPFHLGHLDVIEQSVALFGEVVVGVMHNPTKPSGMFTLDERVDDPGVLARTVDVAAPARIARYV